VLKGLIRAAAHKAGVELTRYTPRNYTHLRRVAILRSGKIDVLVDIGAHDGAWANHARRSGFKGRIESFEPQSAPYEQLARRGQSDGSWHTHKLALSDHPAAETLHLSPDSQSRSLLGLDIQERLHPRFTYTGSETVDTARLDDLGVVEADESTYIKADVQGHELEVINGAERTIETCARVVELELSFVPLYADQALAHVLIAWMAERHFKLASVEASWRDDASGDLLTANGIFVRVD
jgi:FkbM family methyltransferase